MAKVTTVLKPTTGYTFIQTWRWSTEDETTQVVTPKDFTGWTAKCMVRSHPGPTGYVLASDIPITLGSGDGTVTLTIPGDTSWAWKWESGWYDVALTPPGGAAIPFADGMIVPKPGVTHV